MTIKNNYIQFWSFIQKEFYHVFRDSKTLLLLFGMPLVQIVLFGFALTNEINNGKIAICDYAHDAASERIITELAASRYFDIHQVVLSHEEIEESFKNGDIKLAIIFPKNFENDLLHLNNAQVQIIADASDPNTANTLSNYASSIIMAYQKELITNMDIPLQINTDIRMIYNPELKGVYNYVPGVMSLILLLICVLMTSVSIVKEKELGTLEVLLVSPINPFFIIISKLIPYFFLSIVNLTVIILLSKYLMGMPINGSLLLLYTASSILIVTALSLGLLISNVAENQQTAMVFSLMGMMLPTIIFSGFMFPLENMPLPLQIISNIVPSKWYYIIVKNVMIKGLGIESIWKEMLILSGMTLLLLAISFKKFKIRLA